MSESWTKVNRRRYNKKKFRWHDGNGRQLTAGGLLPYDENGIWVITEQRGDYVEWTDPGGKYKFEDCHIYTTIAREFNEELYYSTCLTKFDIEKFFDSEEYEYGKTYVNGQRNNPVYLCAIIHVNLLKEAGVILDPKLFLENREKTLSENPDVPPGYYNSINLEHVRYEDLKNPSTKLSYRLDKILKHSILSNKIYS